MSERTMVTCNEVFWQHVVPNGFKPCGRTYDLAKHYSFCPHERLPYTLEADAILPATTASRSGDLSQSLAEAAVAGFLPDTSVIVTPDPRFTQDHLDRMLDAAAADRISDLAPPRIYIAGI